MVQLQLGGLAVTAAVLVGVMTPHDALAAFRPQAGGPSIELWTSGEVFRRGDRAHVWIRTDVDAYVTVLRFDTDGRVRVLFPSQPWQRNAVRAGHQLEILDAAGTRGSYAFVVDDDPGQGFLFAIASHDPFDYGQLARGDHWDYHAVGYGGYVTGDPYVAVTELIDRIAYDPYSVSYDVYPYHVDRRFDYPRFLCYNCHEQVGYHVWNPYRYSCVRFRIVVYDDPYYYPTRVYPATRVVVGRPHRIEPRYVFKDRTPDAAYVTKTRRRPDDADRGTGARAAVSAPASRAGLADRVRSLLSVQPQTTVLRSERRTTDAALRLLQPSRRTAAATDARQPTARRVTPRLRVRPKLQRRIPSSAATKPRTRGAPPTAKPSTSRRKPPVKPKPPSHR